MNKQNPHHWAKASKLSLHTRTPHTPSLITSPCGFISYHFFLRSNITFMVALVHTAWNICLISSTLQAIWTWTCHVQTHTPPLMQANHYVIPTSLIPNLIEVTQFLSLITKFSFHVCRSQLYCIMLKTFMYITSKCKQFSCIHETVIHSYISTIN